MLRLIKFGGNNMTNKLSIYFVVVNLVSLLFASLTFAQVPEKALIGKWEGKTEGGKNRERTLVINNVKATGSDEWVGYASTDSGNIEISVSKKDNEIYLEYVGASSNQNSYHLKMFGDNKLEGTNELHVGRRTERTKITFEKVKAGEVK
jgi:hypothetical protein